MVPVSGQLVRVIAPVGGARKVPTSPVIVPLVQVTAALASTAKAVRPLLELARSDGEVTRVAESLHAADSSAKATSAPLAKRDGVSARPRDIGILCVFTW